MRSLAIFFITITALLDLSPISRLYAAMVSVKLEDKEFALEPANDLVYLNSPIDSSNALELAKNGFDLSTLHPRTSHLYIQKKLPPSNHSNLNYPKNDETLTYQAQLGSPSEFFRALVRHGNQEFTLSASLHNHTNIMRAGILRLVGYDVDVPKYYPRLSLRFKDAKERDEFIENVGEKTLTNRKRWYHEIKDERTLILKGMTLEPAQLRNVNIYLPLMSAERQRSRRIFRALLNIYLITDFPQSINAAEWGVNARVFNHQLIINHPYANQFPSVTIEDMRWMQKKLHQLSAKEIEQTCITSGLPSDLAALFTQKILARINHLTQLTQTEGVELFYTDKNMSQGLVKSGKLSKDSYTENYVVEFYKSDEESPFRFRQLFRLFRTQLTYSTISSLMDKAITEFVPGLKMNDAIADIQTKMRDQRSQTGKLPLKAYIEPLAWGRVYANRNIVFGQFLSSNAPIQLVDSIGAEVNLGAFSNVSGISDQVLPSVNATAFLGRSYTHVRAMPDLNAATSEQIRKILIPRHFKKLGAVISKEFSCSIPQSPFTQEDTFNGEKIIYVKYDPSVENAKEQAIKLRQDLIEENSEVNILLVAIDREKECSDEAKEGQRKALEEFVKQFALGEIFIVNDTLRLSAQAGANIPVSAIPLSGVNINTGAESGVALLRSSTIRKTQEGLEVTLQTQKDHSHGFRFGLNYFIELISQNSKWTYGDVDSKVYKIRLEGIDQEETQTALKVLSSLFSENETALMQESYDPIEIEHEVMAKLQTFRTLFHKSESLSMSQDVQIIIPNRPGENFTREQRTRRLFSQSYISRAGQDFHSFTDRLISSLVGFISIGQGGQDPGKTFMGSSRKTSVSVETLLDESKTYEATAKVDINWSGWNAKSARLDEIFDQVEDIFKEVTNSPVIDRDDFVNIFQVKSYDVRTTLILYPKSLQKIKHLLGQPEGVAINYLHYLYGEDEWKTFCYRAKDFFGKRGPQNYRGSSGYYECIPNAVQTMLELRHKLELNAKVGKRELTKNFALALHTLFDQFHKERTLWLFGTDSFFATARTTGFREHAVQGFVESQSNTVGTYDPHYGTGIYDSTASFLGLSNFELRAMMYTPGM